MKMTEIRFSDRSGPECFKQNWLERFIYSCTLKYHPINFGFCQRTLRLDATNYPLAALPTVATFRVFDTILQSLSRFTPCSPALTDALPSISLAPCRTVHGKISHRSI